MTQTVEIIARLDNGKKFVLGRATGESAVELQDEVVALLHEIAIEMGNQGIEFEW